MDWTRGDAHYGPDFIQLNSPCQRQAEKPCVCVADFKVVSSSANPAEFANYVTSFEHGKVPVTFEVRYSAEGLFLGLDYCVWAIGRVTGFIPMTDC